MKQLKMQKKRTGHPLAKNVFKYWQLYLMLVPAFTAVFIFHYIPIYGAQIAFKDYRTSLGILGSEWVGFKHFIRFLTYPDFWTIMKNTIILSLYSYLTFPLSIILALSIDEVQNKKFKKTVQMVTYAPHFVSTVIVVSMINLFFARGSGFINTLIANLGVERIAFLEKQSFFPSLYVWTGVWSGLGWGTIVYLAALSGVSDDLIEAARIDGAGRMRIIWNIKIPCILPTVITMLILRTGSLVSVDFEKIYAMQNPFNLQVSRVISTYVYELGIQGAQFSYSSAIGLFNNFINLVLILSVNWISKKVSETSLF